MTCNAESNESGNLCKHTCHCIKDDSHLNIWGDGDDDWHRCQCGREWR